MSEYEHFGGKRMLPQVAVATTAVVLVPVALVWWLRDAQIVTSSWVCVVLAVVFSVAVSAIGSALWKRRDGSDRVVFSELLLWGWIRRVRQERQLANVVGMLGIDGCDDPPDPSSPGRGELLAALATALDAQDPYTEGHSRRVARHASMVARELHLADDEVQRVRSAAAVHDVGKLRIPAAVLSKPGRLTDDEYEVIKRHATEGAALVECLGDDALVAIVRHHHERFDGHGYPAGLSGAEIPLGARIVAVADTFDAITSIRAYRPAESHKQALDQLAAAAGTQLDPAVVRAFVRYYAGRKTSTFWAGLAVVPQRLFAWMHGNSGAAGNIAFGEVAATLGGVLAVGVAAMGTAAAVGVRRAAFHERAARAAAQLAPTAPGGAARTGGRSVAATGRTAVAGGSVHHAAVSALYVAARTPRAASSSRAGSSPDGRAVPGNGVRTGTAQPGGSPGGGRPSVSGAAPPPVNAGGSGQRPKHAGGSGHAPTGSSRPVAVAPAAPVESGPGSRAPVSGPGATFSGPGATSSGPGATSASPGATSSAPVLPTPPSASGGPGNPPGSPGLGPTGAPAPAPNPPPSGPTNKDQCKGGGYAQWGFKNQGQCIASIVRH